MQSSSNKNKHQSQSLHHVTPSFGNPTKAIANAEILATAEALQIIAHLFGLRVYTLVVVQKGVCMYVAKKKYRP